MARSHTRPARSLGLSACEIVRGVASSALTAPGVVEEHIARIESVNPRLNALVLPRFGDARADAASVAAHPGRRPLEGLPVTVKESLDVAGLPTTAGVPTRARPVTRDGAIARRLKAAGAIVLGKTNVPQMLLLHETDNPVYGRANNPWRADRTPGGSSGGEAAIIAAGGAPLGVGTDIGGSIRVPAHFCGIHGLKPTAGRVSLAGSFDETMFPHQAVIRGAAGPLARHVADLARALAVLVDDAGTDDAPPLGDPAAISMAGLRVAHYSDDGFFPAAPAVRRAVREAADALRRRGATVEEFQPPDVRRAIGLFYQLLSADGAAWARQVLRGSRVDHRVRGLLQLAALPRALRPPLSWLGPWLGQRYLGWLIGSVGRLPADHVQAAARERERYRQAFVATLDAHRYDVILCPPHALPALTHGSTYFLGPAASYSMLYNFLDMPAGVVAATRVREDETSDRAVGGDIVARRARTVEAGSAGLPVGVQVAARPWREDVVLAVMEALEADFEANPEYPARRGPATLG